MSDAECPTCGEEFKNEHGRNIHHVQAHGESLAGVEVNCAWCGDGLKRDPCEVENSERFFCGGKSCQGKWRSEHIAGENHPRWEEMVEVQCEYCGASLERYPYVAEDYDMFFCGGDSDCFGLYRTENLTGEDAPNWRGGDVEVVCAFCGDTLTRRRRVVERQTRHFCVEKGCEGQWRSAHRSGEDAPAWKGGDGVYGEGWNPKKRESVRNQQNRECLGCGKDETDIGQNLDVHHVRKARSFDDPLERNDSSNLVALCRDCHYAAERCAPLLPDFISAD